MISFAFLKIFSHLSICDFGGKAILSQTPFQKEIQLPFFGANVS
jgi:hypothetical protein